VSEVVATSCELGPTSALTKHVIRTSARAARSDGCAGVGYQLVNLTTGTVVASGALNATIPAAQLGDRFRAWGVYTSLDIRAADFAVFDQLFTAAANPQDMT
jgi:hypothetical protein